MEQYSTYGQQICGAVFACSWRERVWTLDTILPLQPLLEPISIGSFGCHRSVGLVHVAAITELIQALGVERVGRQGLEDLLRVLILGALECLESTTTFGVRMRICQVSRSASVILGLNCICHLR